MVQHIQELVVDVEVLKQRTTLEELQHVLHQRLVRYVILLTVMLLVTIGKKNIIQMLHVQLVEVGQKYVLDVVQQVHRERHQL